MKNKLTQEEERALPDWAAVPAASLERREAVAMSLPGKGRTQRAGAPPQTLPTSLTAGERDRPQHQTSPWHVRFWEVLGQMRRGADVATGGKDRGATGVTCSNPTQRPRDARGAEQRPVSWGQPCPS